MGQPHGRVPAFRGLQEASKASVQSRSPGVGIAHHLGFFLPLFLHINDIGD